MFHQLEKSLAQVLLEDIELSERELEQITSAYIHILRSRTKLSYKSFEQLIIERNVLKHLGISQQLLDHFPALQYSNFSKLLSAVLLKKYKLSLDKHEKQQQLDI